MTIKEYEIEKNEYVYEQIMSLAKSYSSWTDGDWNYIQFHMDAIYESEGETALFDFFNKTFYNVAHLIWKN